MRTCRDGRTLQGGPAHVGVSPAGTESHLSNSKTFTTSRSELTGNSEGKSRCLHHRVPPWCCGYHLGAGFCQLPCDGCREVLSPGGDQKRLQE